MAQSIGSQKTFGSSGLAELGAHIWYQSAWRLLAAKLPRGHGDSLMIDWGRRRFGTISLRINASDSSRVATIPMRGVWPYAVCRWDRSGPIGITRTLFVQLLLVIAVLYPKPAYNVSVRPSRSVEGRMLLTGMLGGTPGLTGVWTVSPVRRHGCSHPVLLSLAASAAAWARLSRQPRGVSFQISRCG